MNAMSFRKYRDFKVQFAKKKQLFLESDIPNLNGNIIFGKCGFEMGFLCDPMSWEFPVIFSDLYPGFKNWPK